MRRLGIVDIGSNTIRLVVYARRLSGGFRLVDDMHERVRLGQGAFQTGALQTARLEQAIELIRRFADYSHGARLDDVEVIGTSALRETTNGDQLVREARRLGLDVAVLSGREEARYGVLAVANSFDLDDAWVMDLGGGSAQVSRMERRRWVHGEAYPLGALRLTESFLTDDPPTADQVAALEAGVASALGPVVERMRATSDPLVVMGGAVRNLARAVQRRLGYPLPLLHGYWLREEDLNDLTDDLLRSTSAERADVPGIVRGRADVIAAAAAVFRWLLRASGRRGLVVSGRGLREGALFRRELRPPHLIPSIGKAAVAGLMEQYIDDRHHAEHVRRLARKVFKATKALHGLAPRARVILDVGAALHEIGMTVHFYRRQQHGALLLTSFAIDGFTHREQALITLLVRYHHKGTPKLGTWKPLMRDDDAQLLLALTACLRLARAMDRSRGRRVSDFQVTADADTVTLQVPVADPDCTEILELRLQAGIVERAFGRRLAVVAVTAEPPDLDPRLRPRYEER